MKHKPLIPRRLYDRAFIALILLVFPMYGAADEEPELETTETVLASRSDVKSAVEGLFSLPEDMTGIDSLTLENAGAQTELHLSSFGKNVEANLTVLTKADEEIEPDRDEWNYRIVEPQYVMGTPEEYVDATTLSGLLSTLQTAEVFHETVYLVNFTTENEIAAYDKSVRVVFKKEDEPNGSLLVMDILDNVLDFDWNEPTKLVRISPVEE